MKCMACTEPADRPLPNAEDAAAWPCIGCVSCKINVLPGEWAARSPPAAADRAVAVATTAKQQNSEMDPPQTIMLFKHRNRRAGCHLDRLRAILRSLRCRNCNCGLPASMMPVPQSLCYRQFKLFLWDFVLFQNCVIAHRSLRCTQGLRCSAGSTRGHRFLFVM